jgi:hypothetical protein
MCALSSYLASVYARAVMPACPLADACCPLPSSLASWVQHGRTHPSRTKKQCSSSTVSSPSLSLILFLELEPHAPLLAYVVTQDSTGRPSPDQPRVSPSSYSSLSFSSLWFLSSSQDFSSIRLLFTGSSLILMKQNQARSPLLSSRNFQASKSFFPILCEVSLWFPLHPSSIGGFPLSSNGGSAPFLMHVIQTYMHVVSFA